MSAMGVGLQGDGVPVGSGRSEHRKKAARLAWCGKLRTDQACGICNGELVCCGAVGGGGYHCCRPANAAAAAATLEVLVQQCADSREHSGRMLLNSSKRGGGWEGSVWPSTAHTLL